ncbi:MAG: hypothetical protein Q4Q53_00015 [Methanocorpusculum sp.]|nr:hypothetical protein [Methanocorpusculum sp.]
MTTKKYKLAAAVLILSVMLLTVTAAAGTISVDTAGLIGKTTDTILVPVTVSGADNIVAWQFSVKTQDDAFAKIVVSADSVRKAGAFSSGRVVYWFDAGNNRTNHIFGEETLIYLAVTPREEGIIPIEIYDVYIYENSASNESDYTIINGTLTVSGSGSGITAGDFESGATIRCGTTNVSGIYFSGDRTGVVSVNIAGFNESLVTIFTSSAGIFALPERLGYFSVDEVYTELPSGEKYFVTFGVEENRLDELGLTAENLFVLHAVNGKWYECTVLGEPIFYDGTVQLTIETWSSGAFVLGYDKGGSVFQTESIYTAAGEPEPVNTAWQGSGLLIIVITGVFVARKRRRRYL